MMQKWDDPDDSPEGIAPEDGPSRFCLGRSCAESQIILARMLLIAPLLYAGWCASPRAARRPFPLLSTTAQVSLRGSDQRVF